jgi:multidrug efflux pump subunit AcrA (membrane-fusion protein)
MLFIRRSLVGLFLAALTFGLLGTAGGLLVGAMQDRLAEDGRPRTARERIFATRIIAAIPDDIRPQITAFGQISSRRTLEVRVPVGGTIVELSPRFVEGGKVKTGELLFGTDPTDARAQVALAMADLSDATREVGEAVEALVLARDELGAATKQSELRNQALARQSNLRSRGVGTEAAVEAAALSASSAEQSILTKRQSLLQAKTRIAASQNLAERRRINLAEAKRRLTDTSVHAEFDGTLGDVNIVAGGIASTNERVGVLVDPTALEVSFRLSSAQFNRLLGDDGELGAINVTTSLDVFGDQISASGPVERSSAVVGEGVTGRLLFAGLISGDIASLRPGDFVTVTLSEPVLSRVILLPAAAVDTDGIVLVLGEEDRLEEVVVTILRRQGDDVLVRGPLGDREVVAERSPLLGAGIRIRPVRDDAIAPTEPETVKLAPERRDKMIAFVEANGFIPTDRKERIIKRLKQDDVPSSLVARLEGRMGG